MTPSFIEIILDETGSMPKDTTIAGFNKFIAEQKEIDGECYLTLTKFDSTGIKTPYVNLPLHMVPNLTFTPGSMTNLYDVVGQRVHGLPADSHKRLVVVITDGADNQSREHTATTVSRLVGDARERGVTFMYFSADSSGVEIGKAMGFHSGEIQTFTVQEMEKTMAVMSTATRAFRAS